MKIRNRKPEPATSPTEWKKRIMTLPQCLQKSVARIVWWDYFSMRLVSERWPHLDKLVHFQQGEVIPEISTSEMRTALLRVGYTSEKAVQRIK